MIRDHLGKIYANVDVMCRYYHVDRSTYYGRLRHGYTQKEALLGPEKYVCDHLGKKYATETEMCENYNISLGTYSHRIHSGWTIEKALTTPQRIISKNCQDHLGNRYKSETQMCLKWGINRKTFSDRCEHGWTLKDALETPVKKSDKPKQLYADHKGNNYKTVSQKANAYGISPETYSFRKRKGWSEKEALETPTKPLSKPLRKGMQFISSSGVKYTLKSKLNKYLWIVQFEDGKEANANISGIRRNQLSHPTLRTRTKGEFVGFITSPLIGEHNNEIYYEAECKTCKYKNILTPQQMMEHAKKH